MTPSDLRPGLILRCINAHGIGAHMGAIATVEAVEVRQPSGNWVCTIRYDRKRITKRVRFYRSFLWDGDLGCFEIVTDLNTIADELYDDELASRRNSRKRDPFRPVPPRIQLDLPFSDDDDSW